MFYSTKSEEKMAEENKPDSLKVVGNNISDPNVEIRFEDEKPVLYLERLRDEVGVKVEISKEKADELEKIFMFIEEA